MQQWLIPSTGVRSVVKGRPPLNPRIEDLERQVKDLQAAVLELTERIARPLVMKPDYVPQFQRWTINGK